MLDCLPDLWVSERLSSRRRWTNVRQAPSRLLQNFGKRLRRTSRRAQFTWDRDRGPRRGLRVDLDGDGDEDIVELATTEARR